MEFRREYQRINKLNQLRSGTVELMCENTHAFIYLTSCLQHFDHFFKKTIHSYLLELDHSDLEKPATDLSKTMAAIFDVAEQDKVRVVCLEGPYYPLQCLDMERRDEVLIAFLVDTFMNPVT